MRRTISRILAVLVALPLAAQDAPRVHELHEVDAPPAVLNVAEFSDALSRLYPPALRDSAVGGTATVAFVIGADGAVRDPVVVDAARPELGAATLEAVRVLRFAPATVEGEAVHVRVMQPVDWQVDTAAAAAEAPPERTPAAVGPEAHELRFVEQQPMLLNPQELASILAREYPATLRGTGVRARVVARFRVDQDGHPQAVRIVSSTDSRFMEPTRRAVRQLHFRSALVNGLPVRVWVELPFEWSAVR